MKNILVIGGSGFMGSHVADCLTKAGYGVLIFDKQPSPWLQDSQKFLIGDVLNTETIKKALTNDIEAIYFFSGVAEIAAAKQDPKKAINLNIMGLINVLDECTKIGVKRFIYSSSMYVYSDKGGIYRATKQSAELLLEAYSDQYSLDYTILRYGSIYGPRSQSWNGIQKFIKEIVTENKITYAGKGNEIREYIHVEDAAKLSVKILNPEYKNMVVTITGSQPIHVSDMIALIFNIAGVEVNINYKDDKNLIDHYGNTPYRYSPKKSLKLVPSEFVDLGEGILGQIQEEFQKIEKK